MRYSDVKQHLLHKFKSDSDLVKAIETISHNFTKDRGLIKNYLDDERLVSAYTCFYLMTNMPKLDAVMSYLNMDYSSFENFEIIDIGSGPGTFIFSFLEKLPENKLIAVETSDVMQAQAKKLKKAFYPKANVDFYSKVHSVPKKEKSRLGVFTHSANEMESREVQSYIEKLELDAVLFIEPGTKEFFKKSLDIRKMLISKEYNILYPCSSNSICPMGEEDWCHQFLKISHEDDVKRLCQLVKKDRSLLPVTIQYYSKRERVLDKIKRVTRTFKPTKFSLEFQVCAVNDEGDNKLLHLQQLTRNLKKAQVKKIGQIYAGQEINFKETKLMEGKVRGEIDES